jgi:hypothetical protein
MGHGGVVDPDVLAAALAEAGFSDVSRRGAALLVAISSLPSARSTDELGNTLGIASGVMRTLVSQVLKGGYVVRSNEGIVLTEAGREVVHVVNAVSG